MPLQTDLSETANGARNVTVTGLRSGTESTKMTAETDAASATMRTMQRQSHVTKTSAPNVVVKTQTTCPHRQMVRRMEESQTQTALALVTQTPAHLAGMTAMTVAGTTATTVAMDAVLTIATATVVHLRLLQVDLPSHLLRMFVTLASH